MGEEDVENQGAGEIVLNERRVMSHEMEGGDFGTGPEEDNWREVKRLVS